MHILYKLVLVAIAIASTYYLLIYPFGFLTPHWKKKTICSKAMGKTELFVFANTWAFGAIESFLKDHQREVLRLDDAQRLIDDIESRARLPSDSSIICFDGADLWAIEVGVIAEGEFRMTKLVKIYPPSSFGEHYIGVRPRV